MRKKLFAVCMTLILSLGICICYFSFDSCLQGSSSYADAAISTTIPTPEIKAKTSGYEAIKISWDKINGTKKYQVYRATSKSGEYKKIGETSKTYYSDKKIDQNKTYYYKVRAANDKKTSKYSSIKSAKINTVVSFSAIPEYNGSPYTVIKGNKPSFSKRMISEKSSEKYSKLDSLGRPGIAFANIGPDLMPEEERESIGMIKPAGFQTIRYDDLVEGKYLYNRCHLIGYQLTGENANEQNLITGTRYMNVDGMLPFENQIASYTETTGNHVLYRVSPVYSGKNLVCAGLQLEALSVEDGGEGICFNVFVYNVQPGIVIDYASGASRRASDDEAPSIKPSSGTNPVAATYIINISTKKFHYSTCSSVKDMSEKNKLPSEESRNVIVKQGFVACKRCNP